MDQTIKLYDQDAYQDHFEGTVLSCEKSVLGKKEAYAVILDQTLFFPEEGGQSADSGILDGVPVLDVHIKNNVITHYLASPIDPGKKVEGAIDFPERFSKMQQHTGEHIFSGLALSHFGLHNVGFRLSSQETTMDYDGELTAEQVRFLETEANRAIWRNLQVKTEYPSPEVLERLDYRSKIEIQGAVRIVTVEGVDVCACCAPHVRNTGEIGLLKVLTHERYKGGIRIHIVCGERALLDYDKKLENCVNISTLLSAKPDEVAEAVKKQIAQLEKEKQERVLFERRYVSMKSEQIPGQEGNLILFEEDLSSIAQRDLVNALTKKTPGYVMVLCGSEEKGFRYILSAADRDVRPLNKELQQEFSARGGGSAEMTQGQLTADKGKLQEWFISR